MERIQLSLHCLKITNLSATLKKIIKFLTYYLENNAQNITGAHYRQTTLVTNERLNSVLFFIDDIKKVMRNLDSNKAHGPVMIRFRMQNII